MWMAPSCAKADDIKAAFKWILVSMSHLEVGRAYVSKKLRSYEADKYTCVQDTLSAMGLAVDKKEIRDGRGGGQGAFLLRRPADASALQEVVDELAKWLDLVDSEKKKLASKLDKGIVSSTFQLRTFRVAMLLVARGTQLHVVFLFVKLRWFANFHCFERT